MIPVTDITLEMGSFDTQALKDVEEGRPLPKGKDYQQGERYGIATLRAAVFTRDGYTCQCCGRSVKDHAILHVHHIRYRSQGGIDQMSNLITVCEKCHTPADHQPGGKLWNWKPDVKYFKGATYMTAVRWKLYREVKAIFPDKTIHITYGADTKERRRQLAIEKSHVNDTYVMSRFQPLHRAHPVYMQKKRRNNRCLEKFYDAKYIDRRDGKKKSGKDLFNGRINRNHKKDSEDLHVYRQQKVSAGRRTIRKQRYPIQPHDTVIYKGRKYETSGCHNNGTRAILLPDKKSVAIKKLTVYCFSGGYVIQPLNERGEAGGM